MRLICTLDNERDARRFASYLYNQNIQNQLEINTNRDWGSSDYGNVSCQVWIIDEDQIEEAQKLYEEYTQDPENPRYSPDNKELKNLFDPLRNQIRPVPFSYAKEKIVKPLTVTYPLTIYFVLFCCFIFLINMLTAPKATLPLPSLPLTPILFSPIYKIFIFDYPQAFQIVDKLVSLYGTEALKNLAELPQEGQVLLNQFNHTPYWKGFYDQIIPFLQGKQSLVVNAPLFEKIRQGEIWRLVTPIFLHAEIFHLFFNMIWLYLIGKQVEFRLKGWRYILLIVIAAIVTNTAQYLISGASFLGFSGVLCAMLGYIWKRQQKAPWEGYQLQRSTWIFILFFIFTMTGIQFLSFLSEFYLGVDVQTGIANTAHLTGLFLGIVLGSFEYFAAKF